MSDHRQQRVVKLLARDGSGRSLLVDERGELPSFPVELVDGETTMVAVSRKVLPHLGLTGPIIDCLIDLEAAHDDKGAGPIAALVELPPLRSEWQPPAGLRWTEVADADPTIAPGLVTSLQERLEEYQGHRPVPQLRSPWCRAGWYDRARAWIEQTLAEHDRPPPTAITQVRHWGISAVMLVESAGDRCWFKATFPPFHTEAPVSAYLAREIPGAVAQVIAIDEAERWLLLEDLGSETLEQDPSPNRSAVEALVGIQRSFITRTDPLVGIGCERRSLQDLPPTLTRTLGEPIVESLLVTSRERAKQLEEWLVQAVATIDALGIPDTLVHGDFHPGNVAIQQERPVLFDWSDAAVSHPLVDVVTWTVWLQDPHQRDELWAMFFEAWADLVPIDRLAPLRSTIEAVAGAYHTISYARLLAGLEPGRRAENADGLVEFFKLLDNAVPR